MKIVVVLDVMWGRRGQESRRAPRSYKINPHNHSGKRLISLLGHEDFVVTNVCPEYVTKATDRGTPSSEWLLENLAKLKPDMVLVCGNRAQGKFNNTMVEQRAIIVRMPHPAARGWTNIGLRQARLSLAAMQQGRTWGIMARLNMTGA